MADRDHRADQGRDHPHTGAFDANAPTAELPQPERPQAAAHALPRVRIVPTASPAVGQKDAPPQRIRIYSLATGAACGVVEVQKDRPVDRLGKGGFGEAWRGSLVQRDGTRRDVVVKFFGQPVVKDQLVVDDHALESFKRAIGGAIMAGETRAQTLAAGEKSQIVETIGISNAETRAIVMAVGAGAPLSEIIKDRHLEVELAFAVTIGANKAISELIRHQSATGAPEPLGHYDLKPANITTDLRLHKNAQGDEDLREGARVTLIDLDHVSSRVEPCGTPGYVQPKDIDTLEQMHNGASDPYARQEVFAQARMLRRLITGVEPAKKLIDLWAHDERAAYIIAMGEAPIDRRIGNDGYLKLLQGYQAGTPLAGLKRLHAQELIIQEREMAAARHEKARRMIAAEGEHTPVAMISRGYHRLKDFADMARKRFLAG